MAASVMPWDGRPLGEGFLAWGCDGAVLGGSDCWIVAAQDGMPHSIARTRVEEFLALHKDREIVCRNAPEVFWTLDAQLRISSDGAARRQLRRFVQDGRWIDLGIWQRLVDLAEDGYAARPTPLDTAGGEDISTIVAQAVELKSLTQRLLQMPGDVLHVTGADRLGVSYAVKGAVALARQPALQLAPSSVGRAELELRRRELERRLNSFPALRQCYRSEDGSIKADRNWPQYRQERLRRWLRERWDILREPHDYPAPAPHHAGEFSIRPQDWGRIVRCDEQLALWAEFEETFHAIKMLGNAAGDTLPIHTETLPRLKAVPFGSDVLTRVVRFTPTAGKSLIRIRLPDLESRCLAVMCRWRYGQSQLADAAIDSENLNELVADALALDAGPGPLRTDLPTESESARRQVAASLLFATGLKLGDRALQGLLEAAGIVSDLRAIREKRERLVQVFPELEVLECETAATVYARFQADVPREIRRRISQELHIAVGSSTQAPERTSRLHGLHQLHSLGFDGFHELLKRFQGATSAESLAEDLLAEKRRTPSGRVRGRCRLTVGTAEFLDLADDVKKTILFALAVELDYRVAVTADALWAEVTGDVLRAQTQVSALIQAAGATMLSMPLASEFEVISS